MNLKQTTLMLCGLLLAGTASAAVTFNNKHANGDNPIYVSITPNDRCEHRGEPVYEVKPAPAVPVVGTTDLDTACIVVSKAATLSYPIKIKNVSTGTCLLVFKDDITDYWRGPGCGKE